MDELEEMKGKINASAENTYMKKNHALRYPYTFAPTSDVLPPLPLLVVDSCLF